jgi:ribosome assembly protein RRB1
LTGEHDGQAFLKASGSGAKRETITDEMGEFEDAWEDEIESDEEVVDAEAGDKEDGTPQIQSIYRPHFNQIPGMDIDDNILPAIEESEEQPPAPEVYIPGKHILAQDEILEPDDSVYIMRHAMKVPWPCLSFDVLRDNLGDERQRYPATAYIVAGTQADAMKNNEVVVYKMTSLHKTQKDGGELHMSGMVKIC